MSELRIKLNERFFELLIIGGGINGAGLARDAALRGIRTLLVEKGDFACGTSSKSSKLIHGGLRYLEQGNFKLVRQSCQERTLLLKLASQWVLPLPFIMPSYKTDTRSFFKIRAGMFLYDLLASFKNIERHRILTSGEVINIEPELKKDRLIGGAFYYDAQMNDARLCLENIMNARDAGATCLNYVEALNLLKEGGRVCGALLRNNESGGEFSVRAEVVVNATGPWADSVLDISRPGHKKLLRLTKGVHLITKKLTNGEGIFFSSFSDGRIIFVLPWGENSMLGSTDTDYDGDPAQAYATCKDADYLLKEVNRILPNAKLTLNDIITSFAGVRPLLNTGGGSASSVSREHLIYEDESGLISVLGGKYTTFRLVAEQVIAKVIKRLKIQSLKPCMTRVIPLKRDAFDIQDERLNEALRAKSQEFLKRNPRVSLHPRLKSRGFEASRDERFCPHHGFTKADIIRAFKREDAKTISDFLSRRTTIIYSECMGRDCINNVAGVLKESFGWKEDKLRKQTEDYLKEIELNQAFKRQ